MRRSRPAVRLTFQLDMRRAARREDCPSGVRFSRLGMKKAAYMARPKLNGYTRIEAMRYHLGQAPRSGRIAFCYSGPMKYTLSNVPSAINLSATSLSNEVSPSYLRRLTAHTRSTPGYDSNFS